MKDAKLMASTCTAGACAKCYAGMWLITGILLLINAYWPFTEQWTLVAWILFIAGLAKLIKPCCPHCC